MKKLLLLFTFLGIAIGLFAQVSKTVDLATAGTLSSVLTSGELNTVTELTITGTIDARDFKTMRDLMPVLEEVDIANTKIVVYRGTEGTTRYTYYAANEIPEDALGSIFQEKISLISVKLPNTVTIIGNYAFANCSRLYSVTIPSSVTIIGHGAFSKCVSLTSIIIPSTLSKFGFQAFYYCKGPFIVDKENPNYSSLDGIIFNKDQTDLIQCPISKTGSYIIPSSAISISKSAFSGCNGLTSVAIPSSVTYIGGNAFSGCSGLTSIYALSPIPVVIDIFSSVFAGANTTTCKLYVPVGSSSAYEIANEWKDFTNIYEKNFTGIDQISNGKQLTVYPNPTSGKIKLKFDQIPQAGTHLAVTDISGKIILKKHILNEVEWIDIGENTHGIYFLKTNLKNFEVQKIILK